MIALTIDFAPQSLRRTIYLTSARNKVIAIIAVAASILTTLVWTHDLSRLSHDKAVLLQARATMHNKIGQIPTIKPTSIPDVKAGAVNDAIGQLNLPWRDMLDALEDATPASIALLAIEPDAKNRTLKGGAEAKSSSDMVQYIAQLKKQKFFNSVVLTRHDINELDQNKPYRFQFDAQWTDKVTQ